MNRKLLFTLMMMLFGLATPALAETLTVYEGTVTNNTVPAYVFYWDDFSRAQTVIPAADLEEMAGGTITSIKFYTSNNNIPYTSVAEADVYLMEVDYTSISAYEPKESAEIVYHGIFDFVATDAGGEVIIEFETPYEYDGGNLLIGIDNTTDAGYKSIYFYGQQIPGASISGSNGSDPAAVGVNQRNFIPQTTFEFTPSGDYVAKPKNVAVSDITNNSAKVSWEGSTEAYNLRYRTTAVVSGINETFEDVANGSLPEGWTTIDADGDGYNWAVWVLTLESGSTQITLSSNSYVNYVGALTPDNWVITPKSKLGTQVSFDAWGQDPSYAAEHMRVYVSTTGTETTDFTPISEEIITTGDQTTYTYDIPEEAVGHMGYIALRHFNVTDQYILNVSNFQMLGAGEDIPEGEWVVVENVANPYTLEGLEALTEYEVQVQSVYETREVTDWSKSAFFTTLEGEEETGIEELYMVGSFNGWNQTEEGGRIAFELNDGEFVATADLEAGAEFKLITPVEGGWRWFGGIDENQVGYFLINEDLLGVGLDLVEGSNFRIEEAGSYTISVCEAPRGLNEPLKMTVTKNLPTAITDLNSDSSNNTWYNIQGMKLQGVPTVPGIYINGGKKVVVK